MPNGMYGGARGERKSSLFDFRKGEEDNEAGQILESFKID